MYRLSSVLREANENSKNDKPQEKTSAAAAAAAGRTLRIHFPPVKSREEVMNDQSADVPLEAARQGMEGDIPPVVRSVLEITHMMMTFYSKWLRASPAYAGGMFYQGAPYCFASGYRDSTLPMEGENKANFYRLKDPVSLGSLSLPITAAYLCELHGKKVFDMERPLVSYLPELEDKVDASVTARSILAFTSVLDESVILADAGCRTWRPALARNCCAAMQESVYTPISQFLAGGRCTSSGAPHITGRQQRENLVQYVRASTRITGMRRVAPHRAAVSHFTVALLVAAVERQLKGPSFEESIRSVFFEPSQSHGAGYGAPRLWRNPNDIFYQPAGLTQLHQKFSVPVPSGSDANCGPPVFNASLNLYAPVEEYAKLLMLSLDTILEAREILGCPDASTRRSHYYDFGVLCVPRSDELMLRTRPTTRGMERIPASAAFRYDWKRDLGCLGVATCGTRRASRLANDLTMFMRLLVLRHVLKDVDINKPVDLDDPMGTEKQKKETATGFDKHMQRVVDEQRAANRIKTHDLHKRF